jgi:hypothetical protein
MYTNTDIWRRDEKKRSSWRNGRGIGEEICKEVCEKIGEEMGKKGR